MCFVYNMWTYPFASRRCFLYIADKNFLIETERQKPFKEISIHHLTYTLCIYEQWAEEVVLYVIAGKWFGFIFILITELITKNDNICSWMSLKEIPSRDRDEWYGYWLLIFFVIHMRMRSYCWWWLSWNEN